MFILNHSCKVEQRIKVSFIEWLTDYFKAFENEGNDYRYSQLLAPVEDDGTDVVIIQVFVEKIEGAWDLFLQEQQENFQSASYQKFGGDVLSFLTLMKVLDKK